MTVTIRSGCPTNKIPIELKFTVQTIVILKRGSNGHVVRKLFQPKELSTDMQKETRTYLCNSKRLSNKSKTH